MLVSQTASRPDPPKRGTTMGEKSDRIVIVAIVVPVKEQETKATSGKVTSRPVTDAYCQGWENIFGKKQEVGQA